MAAAEIHAWLQGPRPFADGVALLIASGEQDETLLFLLDLGETRVSRKLLDEALLAIRRKLVDRTLAIQASSPGRELVTKADIHAERALMARDPRSDGYTGMELPPELAELRDALPGQFKEMNYYRARLELTVDDADRRRDCFTIAAIDAAIVKTYARLDAWKATGRDPGAAPAPPATNGAKLQRELGNIVSYLARHNSGARPASAAKVAAWEARKDELQKLIDALPAE